MTTSKPYHGRETAVAFKRPTVGARVYVITSVSGWAETHDRKKSDAAAVKYLHPLPIVDVLAQFATEMQLEARADTWADVVAFLAKVTGNPEKSIPVEAIIGFWGQYVVFEHQQGAN